VSGPDVNATINDIKERVERATTYAGSVSRLVEGIVFAMRNTSPEVQRALGERLKDQNNALANALITNVQDHRV